MYDQSKIALFLKEEEPLAGRFTPDLKGLIAWLETQDGATEYNWANCHDCLLARFRNARGFHGNYVQMLGGGAASMAIEIIARDSPWTYSSALSRARAAREAV